MDIKLLIKNNSDIFFPAVVGEITLQTDREDVPGQLEFSVKFDNILKIEEGNVVALAIDKKNLFYGFIFKISQEKNDIIEITAYDQLRYFKNKDSIYFKNMSLSDIIRKISKLHQLNVGTINTANHKIKSKLEENTTLFDMVKNAIQETAYNTGKLYVLYDDFGKLCLKNAAEMKLEIIVNKSNIKSYSYTTSIDDETYNKIKIVYEKKENGKTKKGMYIAQDEKNIKKWGILQDVETAADGENYKIKAKTLLSLHNIKTKNLTVETAVGDTRVRAGSCVYVDLDVYQKKINQWMLVEKCTHVFSDNMHKMELVLSGGGFIA